MDKNIVARKHKILGTVIKVKGRIVGQVIGTDYVKDIKNSHMLTYPPSIANDIQALHDAERAGAVYCVFTNTETGIVYRASIAKIWDAGRHVNFGYGDQQALTLSYWTQPRNPEYIASTSTALEYSDANGTHIEDESEIKPLNIKSRARTGTHYTKGKQTPKQLRMFGNGGHYE